MKERKDTSNEHEIWKSKMTIKGERTVVTVTSCKIMSSSLWRML